MYWILQIKIRFHYAECQENFQVNFVHITFFKEPNNKIHNRAKALYCDTIIYFF